MIMDFQAVPIVIPADCKTIIGEMNFRVLYCILQHWSHDLIIQCYVTHHPHVVVMATSFGTQNNCNKNTRETLVKQPPAK